MGACIRNILHLRQLVLQKSGGDSLLAALYPFRGRQQFMGYKGAAGESLEKDGRPSLGRYDYEC